MYILLKLAMFVLSKLPLRAVQHAGSFLGIVAWYLIPERRRVAVINASIIGSKEPEKTAKESFRHSFMSYLETSYIHNIDKKFIDKYVTVEGEEHYHALVSSGQNFSFISAHIGSWDLATPVTSLFLGFKALIVGRESESKALTRVINEQRNNPTIVHLFHKGYLEKISFYEKQGYITGSLLDHSTTKSDSVIAPFFGYRVRTLAGICAMCARKKTPMLPCYLVRVENGFRLIIHAPIYPDLSLKPRERVLDMCAKMNSEFELIIKMYPEQWYLLHKRFKKVELEDGTISEHIYR